MIQDQPASDKCLPHLLRISVIKIQLMRCKYDSNVFLTIVFFVVTAFDTLRGKNIFQITISTFSEFTLFEFNGFPLQVSSQSDIDTKLFLLPAHPPYEN